MLVGLIVAIFIILLVLGVAAPRVARALRRDKEQEAIHRGNQYTRAIQLYYRKLGHYPGSLDQLEKTNNIRFLRQRYVDPMTGKADWRLIHAGEAKTTVKGFFGKPLAGIANSGLGAAAGMVSPGAPNAGAATGSGSSSSSFGSSNSFGSSSSFGSSNSNGTASTGSNATGASSTGSSGFGSNSSGNGSSPGMSSGNNPASSTANSSGIASQSASSFSGGGAPIVGVSSMASGDSIFVLNEQKTYATWEFLYDPRIEQLKAQAGLLGGGSTGLGGTSGFGSGSSTGSGSSSFGSGSGSGTSGFGSSSFGNSNGTGTGSGTGGSGFGFGSGNTNSNGGSSPQPQTTTPPQ